jgi:hypothetical protein
MKYFATFKLSLYITPYMKSMPQNQKIVGCVTSPVFRTGPGFILVIDRGG